MKKVILFLMLILSSLSFAAKKLYVGTNAEFAPYEYLENGKMVGFDIELMDAIGEELGYEIVWSNMSFDGLLPALQMKKLMLLLLVCLKLLKDKKLLLSLCLIYFSHQMSTM